MIKQNQTEFAASKGVTLQPYILIAGDTRYKIQDIYLCIDKNKYQMPDLSTAIDICFKSFQVFHAKYPDQGEHLWLLIQKAIYNIHTKWDARISLVSQILNDIKINED